MRLWILRIGLHGRKASPVIRISGCVTCNAVFDACEKVTMSEIKEADHELEEKKICKTEGLKHLLIKWKLYRKSENISLTRDIKEFE